jgi:hypothetical protein
MYTISPKTKQKQNKAEQKQKQSKTKTKRKQIGLFFSSFASSVDVYASSVPWQQMCT